MLSLAGRQRRPTDGAGGRWTPLLGRRGQLGHRVRAARQIRRLHRRAKLPHVDPQHRLHRQILRPLTGALLRWDDVSGGSADGFVSAFDSSPMTSRLRGFRAS
ncbi:uncharacterized protein LOC119591207 [Penaeus monodon]|uniref:uncharacterized protein LOC119591207 n=1 Tax=Penaeus monodon TaxID=6687 RepID=UPI0018A72236|nr:uncharacterized protein LOC119591207 [Penaeus monodon]